MRKFIVALIFACVLPCALCGCGRKVDYFEYVSEKRTDIFMYCGDDVTVKIFLCEKETPFATDGIKGEMSALCEIFVTLPTTYDEVTVSAGGIEGEMNYRAVDNVYYLSASGGQFVGESADVKLKFGNSEQIFAAINVKHEGVISCKDAVSCAIEHDGALFEALTDNGIFCGEIFVRLLYDDGCYYYVGVCDRNKKITAYLIDGERGKVITKKEIDG